MSGNQEMPHTLVISPKLRTSVKGARVQYEYAQEQGRKAKAENEPLKQQLDDDIKKLKAKSKELKKIALDLANEATEKHADRKLQIKHNALREGNALKRKSCETVTDAEKIDVSIKLLQEKRHKIN